jgi:hypothetical protein
LLGAPRLAYRAWKEHTLARNRTAAVRVLILGAGRAGEALVRDCARTGAYEPVGFLDDAAQLRGSRGAGRARARADRVDRRDRARNRRSACWSSRCRPCTPRCCSAWSLRANARPAVPHGAAPGRHARRALAAGRTEGSRDRRPARPQSGDAGLEVDPRVARRAFGAGHRRRRLHRRRTEPPVRQARRAPRGRGGNRRTRS